MINNVQKRHGGIYECQITAKKKLARLVKLNISGNLHKNSDATI